MYKNIDYQTRLYTDPNIKCVAGSFGGGIDIETVNRLVNNNFDVVIKPSGFPVFVDRKGREVYLYLTVSPSITEKGKKVIEEWTAAERKREKELEKQQEQMREEIDSLIDSMGYDEAIKKLKS